MKTTTVHCQSQRWKVCNGYLLRHIVHGRIFQSLTVVTRIAVHLSVRTCFPPQKSLGARPVRRQETNRTGWRWCMPISGRR